MTLARVSWRHLLRHPWQTILMIIGISLGVAVAVAVDLANESASRAFDLSTETVAGKATHQIYAGITGMDQAIYTRLRRVGVVQAAAPVIQDYASSPQLGDRPLQLLGLDPFADAPFRSYLGSDSQGTGNDLSSAVRPSIIDLTNFLTQPGAILIADSLANRYGLQPGQQINLEVAGRSQPVTISGLLKPADRLSQRALEGLILTDIGTAQELTGRLGKLDRIDLILSPSGTSTPDRPCGSLLDSQQSGTDLESCLNAIEAQLPSDVRLQPVEARSGTVQQMTSAFRVNLTALSLLALVVGMFLIYNTMTFSVVQRRPLFGTLRCLGVTRREVFGLVLSEALIVGLVGSLSGVFLGILMGQGAVRLVTQTINDLFFVVTVRGIQIPTVSLAKGLLLGLMATLLTAAPPAWEAASVPPRVALSRSGLESKALRAATLAAWIGLGLIVIGIFSLFIAPQFLVISFFATFTFIVGFAMLVPLVTKTLMRWVTPGLGRIWGTLGRMAPRDVVNALSRTAIAVMALMVAVSVTIGVSLMVSSFRYTVVAWLGETLQGDIYVSAPSLTATTPSTEVNPQVISKLKAWPGIARVDVLRAVTVDSPNGPVQVAATDNQNVADERIFISSAPPDELWDRLQEGSVLVSEPFANRNGVPRQGGKIALFTQQGLREFPVAGIYYDYASTQGTVLMALPVYQQLWEDAAITALALRVNPGTEIDQLVQKLQDELSAEQDLLIRSNRALREEVLVVFDRTFAITSALQLLATVVAFIGILSALLSLELERQHELGILRSIGLTVRQLWGLILLETGLMGAVAGLLAMPAGYALSLILVYIINRRSFGWTLQMQIDWQPFLSALLLAVIAAILAGIYPARRIGKMIPSEALRSE